MIAEALINPSLIGAKSAPSGCNGQGDSGFPPIITTHGRRPVQLQVECAHGYHD